MGSADFVYTARRICAAAMGTAATAMDATATVFAMRLRLLSHRRSQVLENTAFSSTQYGSLKYKHLSRVISSPPTPLPFGCGISYFFRLQSNIETYSVAYPSHTPQTPQSIAHKYWHPARAHKRRQPPYVFDAVPILLPPRYCHSLGAGVYLSMCMHICKHV